MSKELELIAGVGAMALLDALRKDEKNWTSERDWAIVTAREHFDHVVSVLAASGHTIVAHSEIREMIGPSREVDNCPKCGETVTWEKSAYDMRDNDDHRYSWVAYCEVCKLDLELTPDPNPPIAAAEEDQ